MEYLHIDFNELESNIYRFNESEEYERIIIKNGREGSTVLFPENVVIQSNKSVLIQECDRLLIEGVTGYSLLAGGLQVDGSISKLEIKNLSVINGHIGLHMSQHTGSEKYGEVIIRNSRFIGHNKEAIYIGKSDADSDAPMINSVVIFDTNCMNNGWDGLQVSRSHFTEITNCNLFSNGKANYAWQDFDLTINPKCQDVRLTNVKFESAQLLQAGKIFIRP